MLTLYYAPGACSTAAHIVLEESGETYEPIRVDLADRGVPDDPHPEKLLAGPNQPIR